MPSRQRCGNSGGTSSAGNLHRHGSRHDLYLNPKNGRKAPVPRHNEIKDSLCRVIRKQPDVE